MSTPVIMPKLGLTMETGTLVSWRVAVGDTVTKGQVLAEIATDKIAQEIEAPCAGTVLSLAVAAGADVPVLAELASIGAAGEVAAAPAPATHAAAPAVSSALPGERPGSTPPKPADGAQRISPRARRALRERSIGLAAFAATHVGIDRRLIERDVLAFADASAPREVRISPRARTLCDQHGIDLQVFATLNKRVTESDVIAHLDRRVGTVVLNASEAPASRPAPAVAPPAVQAPATPTPAGLIPLTRLQQVAAQRLTESFRDIPQFSIRRVVSLVHLNQVRAAVTRRTGQKASLNDALLRAVALAIARDPAIQRRYTPNGLEPRPSANLGMAVATDVGLVVPVVREAQTLRLEDLARRTAALIHAARSNKLGMDDLMGGTFTLSNLGMFGVTSFVPIVNPGESAILGIGAARDELRLTPQGIVAVPVLELTCTGDHRALDGAIVAQFLRTLGQIIESEPEASW